MVGQSSRSILQKCCEGSISLEGGINKLPDELLVEILSFLTVEEAVSTSILARRWRHLWTFVSGSLDFDVTNVVQVDDVGDDFTEEEIGKLYEAKAPKYMEWMNHVIEAHQGRQIRSLRFSFPLDISSSPEIDNWIKFAIAKNVERLELDNLLDSTTLTMYRFPDFHRLFSLSKLNASTQPDFNPFSCLKSLRLTNLIVTDEALHHILVNCCNLENLCFIGVECLVNFKVTSPKLKYLGLSRCISLEDLEISAPNLVSFEYAGDNKILRLAHVPSLCCLSLACSYCESFISNPHSSYLSQLTKLKLEPSLLDFGFTETTREMELEVLKLCDREKVGKHLYHEYKPSEAVHRRGYGRWEWEERKTKHAHKCLEVVQLLGFANCESVFELALHLLDTAVELKEMIIDTRPQLDGQIVDPDQSRAAVEHAQLLQYRIPPGSDLFIVRSDGPMLHLRPT